MDWAAVHLSKLDLVYWAMVAVCASLFAVGAVPFTEGSIALMLAAWVGGVSATCLFFDLY